MINKERFMKQNSFNATGCLMLAIFFLVNCSSKKGNPLANAGDDQKVLISDTVTLNGLSSTGVDSALWSFTSKPAGSSAVLKHEKNLDPTFIADTTGDYEIQLSINKGVSTDTVKVSAKKVLAKINVDPGSTITTRDRFDTTEYVMNLEQAGGILTGEDSRGDVTAYQWSQISGPGATPVSTLTETALQFSAPSLAKFLMESDKYKWQPLPVSREITKMIFKLVVFNTDGDTDSDTIIIWVQDNGDDIQTASGLPNAGKGTSVYLQGPSLKANSSSASTNVTDWSWTITPPDGSSSKFADTGLATSTLQIPKFIPDISGLYSISYASTSAAKSGTILFNVAEWVGVGTIGGASPRSPECAVCHNGTIEDDVVTPWASTMHASIFENSMSTYAGLAPTPYLWQYHTVGWDTSSSAVNGGFDDLISHVGFEFPETGLTYDQFTSEHPDIAKLANVQCENCHGPGSQHSGDPLRISFSFSQSGICGQCHIEKTEWANAIHNSTGIVHAAGRYQLTNWRAATCVRCHTAKGFVQYVEEGDEGLTALSDTGAFPGITCQACHDPHDATNPSQLMLAGNVVMAVDNSTVDAGKSATCYMCHDGFYSKGEHDCDTDEDGIQGLTSSGAIADTDDVICTTIDQMATKYFRGIHFGTQSPVFEGKGAILDLDGAGSDTNALITLTENSFHSGPNFTLAATTGDNALPATNDKCITCHMSQGPSINDDGYQNLGGHTFKLRSGHGIGHLQGEETGSENYPKGDIELASACTSCHPSITDSFNRTARADYDGDVSIKGIQDEVKGLLLALSNRLKGIDPANLNTDCGLGSCGSTQAAGVITVDFLNYAGSCSSYTGACAPSSGVGSCSNIAASKTRDDYQQCNIFDADPALRRALWNYNMIVREGSLGVHNAAFTIQLLQKTFTAISLYMNVASYKNSFAAAYPNATLR